MPKLIIQQPYVIKSSCRKERLDQLVKSWKEDGVIAVDATTRITLIKDEERVDEIIASDIVDNDKWTTITESTFVQYEPSLYECPKCSKRVTVRTPFCPECGDDKRLRVKVEDQ